MLMLEKAEVSKCTKWPITTPNSIQIGEVKTMPPPGTCTHWLNNASGE